MPTIPELPAASSVASTDLLVISDGTTTKKVPVGTLLPVSYSTASPTLSWSDGGTAPIISSALCTWFRVGEMVYCGGRFQIGSVGSGSGSAFLIMTPPSGFLCGSPALQSFGQLIYGSSSNTQVGIAQTTNNNYIRFIGSAAGNYVSLVAGGWYSFFAIYRVAA